MTLVEPDGQREALGRSAEALLLVTAAIETGLLPLLEREWTAEEIARERGLSPRAVAISLAALEELGVVERGRRGHRLTLFGRSRFTDPSSPDYVGGRLPLWRASLGGWLVLDEVLRSGKGFPENDSPGFRARLHRHLDEKPAARVERVVSRVLERAPVARPRVLDVGGGTGSYARGFLARGCRVTLLERPDVLGEVRGSFGLDRLRDLDLVAGDFEERLPEGPYEAVLLAEVVHLLPPAAVRALLARAAGACAVGGIMAVVERLRARSRGAALFAVSLLLTTEGGDTYGEGELCAWLAEAGFGDPAVEDLEPDQALVTARRESGSSRRSG